MYGCGFSSVHPDPLVGKLDKPYTTNVRLDDVCETQLGLVFFSLSIYLKQNKTTIQILEHHLS